MKEMTISRLLWPFYGNVSAQIVKLGSRLNCSDISFAAILLAFHSVLWPYRGIVHDAKFYAIQALNNLKKGHYANDLFFEFGSQDNYSAFSYVMAPFIDLIGLDIAFWLAYMAASAIFIYATVRIFRILIPDSGLANIAALASIAIPIFYGGWGSFRIHESFFTARMVAQGFGLLGIAAIYRKYAYRAVGFALMGVAFHPIMGTSSFLVILAMLIKERLRSKLVILSVLLPLLGMLLLTVFFRWDLISPWITRDELRYALVKQRTFTCFPLQWHFVDWYRMVGSVAIIWTCCGWLPPRAKALTRLIVWIGIAGIATSVTGELFSFPILIQGQGYRAFWQIQVLALPLGFLAMIRFSSGFSAWSSWSALGAFIFLGNPFFVGSNGNYLAIVVFQTGIFLIVLAFFLFSKAGNLGNRRSSALLFPLLITAGLSLSIAGGIIRANSSQVTGIAGISNSLLKLGSQTFVLMIVLWVLYLALSVIKTPSTVTAFSLSVWFSVSLVTFMLMQSPEYKERRHPEYRNVPFIRETITYNSRHSGESLKDKQIYWPECFELIWFELRANSYYSYAQLSGAVFFKETILEGSRRARLARPFEIARLMQTGSLSIGDVQRRLSFLKVKSHEPPPTKNDLIRLANDTKLDWIVLDIGFEGLYSAANGSVYIYDCSKIRRRQ